MEELKPKVLVSVGNIPLYTGDSGYDGTKRYLIGGDDACIIAKAMQVAMILTSEDMDVDIIKWEKTSLSLTSGQITYEGFSAGLYDFMNNAEEKAFGVADTGDYDRWLQKNLCRYDAFLDFADTSTPKEHTSRQKSLEAGNALPPVAVCARYYGGSQDSRPSNKDIKAMCAGNGCVVAIPRGTCPEKDENSSSQKVELYTDAMLSNPSTTHNCRGYVLYTYGELARFIKARMMSESKNGKHHMQVVELGRRIPPEALVDTDIIKRWAEKAELVCAAVKARNIPGAYVVTGGDGKTPVIVSAINRMSNRVYTYNGTPCASAMALICMLQKGGDEAGDAGLIATMSSTEAGQPLHMQGGSRKETDAVAGKSLTTVEYGPRTYKLRSIPKNNS